MRTSLFTLAVGLGLAALAGCNSDDTGSGGAGGAGGGDATTGATGGNDAGTGGTGGGATGEFSAIWEDVAYLEDGGRAEVEGPIDELPVEVRVAGTEDVALSLKVSIPDDAVAHVYAVGLVEDETLDVLLVSDLDELPELFEGEGGVRLAHLSPDAPSVDVYLVDADGNEIGPLLGSDGASYLDVTTYGAFDAGAYDIAVVLPGDGPADAIITFEGVTITEGEYQTLAAVGTIANDDLGLAEYLDDVETPPAGFVGVTFVHAASDAPNVDVGIVE